MKITDFERKTQDPLRVLLDGFSVSVDNHTLDLTGHWVEVISTESETFKEAELSVRRDLFLGVKLSQVMIDALVKSALIVAWSFEDECTEANKVQAIQLWPKRLTDFIVKRAEGIVNVNFTIPKQENLSLTLEKSGG